MSRPATPVRHSIVVMGVAGCGKTVVGRAIAGRLGSTFADADDLHSDENVTKMASGLALDDRDREEWLGLVGRWLAQHPDGSVMACSALRRRYRDTVRDEAPDTVFVHLQVDPDVVEARVNARSEHFMPASLIASQFQALEPLEVDETGVIIEADRELEDIVDDVLRAIGYARR